MPYFEIKGDRHQGYWFRLCGANGQIVCWSEKYTTLQSCQQATQWVRQAAPQAQIVNNAA
ncbi:MAG TPA: DUF1508 domain-containing protein [Actinomycetota bacterium]|nr:DUF1508 domain-containing protein [Actinomycetota bacterium]